MNVLYISRVKQYSAKEANNFVQDLNHFRFKDLGIGSGNHYCFLDIVPL